MRFKKEKNMPTLNLNIPSVFPIVNKSILRHSMRFAGFFARNIALPPSDTFIPRLPKSELEARGQLILNTLSGLKNLKSLSLKPVEARDTWYYGKFISSQGDKIYQGTVNDLTVEVIDVPAYAHITRSIAVYKTGHGGEKGTFFLHLQNAKANTFNETPVASYPPNICVLTGDKGVNNASLIYKNREDYYSKSPVETVEKAVEAYQKLKPLLEQIDQQVPDPEWATEENLNTPV
jgi:hypothetical protein